MRVGGEGEGDWGMIWIGGRNGWVGLLDGGMMGVLIFWRLNREVTVMRFSLLQSVLKHGKRN